MKVRFQELWKNCKAKSNADEVYEDLEKRYSEPHRFYHNLKHIGHCLNHLDMLPVNAPDSIIVEFALWFHDAIYNPSASDNEEKSAKLARRICQGAGLTEMFCRKAQDLILITKHTSEPENDLQKIMIDLDLCILGSDPEMYDNFESDIRKEYSHVKEKDFLIGRSKILEGFLNRQRVFYTDIYYRKYEKTARFNLARTIQNQNPMKGRKSPDTRF
jgi:predicted metal-dependent HD superfamily phosphohydrolase